VRASWPATNWARIVDALVGRTGEAAEFEAADSWTLDERQCAGWPRRASRTRAARHGWLLLAPLGASAAPDMPATPTPEESARVARCGPAQDAPNHLAYITGAKEFWSRDFDVGPGVTGPSPDTETLIEEEAIRLVRKIEMIASDRRLGAGSGCDPDAALKEFSNAAASALNPRRRSHTAMRAQTRGA